MMSQGFKRSSKWRTNSPAYLFLQLTQQFQVGIQSNLRRKKLHRTNQCSIFLEAVLAIEKMEEPQSNLEEKVNPIILIKDEFFSRTDPSIFTSISPVFFRLAKENWLSFFSNEINKLLPSPQYLVGQIQVQTPILVVATDQMSDHI